MLDITNMRYPLSLIEIKVVSKKVVLLLQYSITSKNTSLIIYVYAVKVQRKLKFYAKQNILTWRNKILEEYRLNTSLERRLEDTFGDPAC